MNKENSSQDNNDSKLTAPGSAHPHAPGRPVAPPTPSKSDGRTRRTPVQQPAGRDRVMATRKHFRSQSVSSSDPRSPYFTNYWLQTRPRVPAAMNRSPSVSCVPQYDACCSELNQERKKGKKGDIPGLNLTLSPNDPKASTIRQHYYPEGGWGWIVMCCALLVHAIAGTFQFSVGFFVIEMSNRFLKGEGALEPVIIGAVSTATSLFLAPVAVALCKRRSARLLAILGGLFTSLGCLFTSFTSQMHQLYLSHGVFAASGDCLARETAAIMIGQYFKRRREQVEILFLVGYGVGVAVMPLLLSNWIRTLGWRRGLQVLAGLQSLTCVIAVFYRPASLYHPQRRAILHIKSLQKRSKAKDKAPVIEKRPFLDFSVLKSRTVQILITGTGITSFGIGAPFFLLMRDAQRDNLDVKSMYQLQVFFGLSIALGATAFGLIDLKNSIHCMIAKQYMCQTASFLLSGWFLAYPTLHGYHGYVLFVWVYGILYGGYVYSLKLCVFEKVRARNFARTWSFLQCGQALPTLIGVPLSYYISSVFGMKRGYYFSSLTMLVGTLTLFLIDIHKNQVRKEKQLQMQHNADIMAQKVANSRRPSQDTLFKAALQRSYVDLRKAQELTCISEEILVDNFIEDYIDDCITSCNKEEKFLMLSEFENNLFKTDESLEREKCTFEERYVEPHHYCTVCNSDANQRVGDTSLRVMRTISSVDVIDEATSSL